MPETAPQTPSTSFTPLRPDRAISLTDAVVAIAMTLLALDLRPEIGGVVTSGHLAHYLYEHAGQYAAFAISFGLIAQYWAIHRRMMSTVQLASAGLMRSTIVFLFAITLIPLTTYVTGNYGNSLAVSIFAANMFLVSLSLAALGEVIHHQRLDEVTETPADRVLRRSRNVMTLLIPGLVAGMAWVIGDQAAWLYFLFFAASLPGRALARRIAS